jgi:Transport and Golgi organisation 2
VPAAPDATVIGVCTVLLRFLPGTEWPLLLAAVRDEFGERAWDPPASHWPDRPNAWGGRDRLAGGTWLAVDRATPAVAALLNGVRREPAPNGKRRPTRGTLPLAALRSNDDGDIVPGIHDREALVDYDGFHLLRADSTRVDMWSWDGANFERRTLTPGDHIIVNVGLDNDEDPLVPHFRPLFAALADPKPRPGLAPAVAWNGWLDLLLGDGLGPTDERGLIIDHVIADEQGVDHHYGSTSATLVAIGADGSVRYDFTSTPASPHWYEVVGAERTA